MHTGPKHSCSLNYGFRAETIFRGRLITGHFTHSDLVHAQWDIAAFAIVGALLEQWGHHAVLFATTGSILFIDLWLWWGMTDLDFYCGLSGVINALLGLLLINLWQEKPTPLLMLTSFLIIAKLIIETTTGLALFTHTAWLSVPSVHLAGFGFATIWGLITPQATQLPAQQSKSKYHRHQRV